jgi:septum formation protein
MTTSRKHPARGDAPLLLASASAARAELLRAAGFCFRQIAAGVAEPPLPPGAMFRRHLANLARSKALAVAARYPRAFVIGADTALELDGELLGKPADLRAAHAMLRKLAGRAHSITTAICVVAPRRSAGCRVCLTAVDSARVALRAWPEPLLRRYLRRARPFHCAGAYAVQGAGSALIRRIDGDLGTVIGLPLDLVVRLLRRLKYFDQHRRNA